MSHINIVGGGTRARKHLLSVDALADFGYQIINQRDIFALDSEVLPPLIGQKKALFVLSSSVYQLYGDKIEAYLRQHLSEHQYKLTVTPSGELNKNIESMLALCSEAKAFGMDRDGLFIAVGGGIVLDMVGFAASIYRRGTKYIKIPTTLLGQVDVAVGVKTGINFEKSKNMLGTYYPAYATINDECFLQTLPERELRCGMAEVLKMGLVCDEEIFQRVEDFYKTNNDIKQLDYKVFIRAMVSMIEELQPNLLELELERLVDFGHTFSMRFETHTEHKHLHGEAVAMDMALSCCIAMLLGKMSQADCYRSIHLLQQIGLPIFDRECCTLDSLLASIEDVSLHRNAVNLVIPMGLGEGYFVKSAAELPRELLSQALTMLAQWQQTAGELKMCARQQNTQLV